MNTVVHYGVNKTLALKNVEMETSLLNKKKAPKEVVKSGVPMGSVASDIYLINYRQLIRGTNKNGRLRLLYKRAGCFHVPTMGVKRVAK